ncbi:MAG TPA: hypothetical protein VEX35_04345 [Allosphingosinicella sp.]|nr:hypothetical protein [Allosphingosinicella sp.]
MSPDRAQDRTLQLSQGLFGAPPERHRPDRPSPERKDDAAPGGNAGR